MPLQNTFTLDVDFKHKSIINEPTVTQNDEVTFILNVYDDGKEFDLSGVSTSTLVSERPDKQSVMTLGSITGTNQITFALGSTEISKVGKVDAAIQLYDVEGRVTTMPFTYKVLKDPGTGYIPSTDEQTLIELVLGEGPVILKAAEMVTAEANEFLANNVRIGEYDNTVAYVEGNEVGYGGSSYVALQDTQGNLPTDTVYWALRARKGLGDVNSVNDVLPDTNGNVTIPIPNPDLSAYATKEELIGKANKRWYDIKDYGADHNIDSTAAIQAAINDCSANGGGEVRITSGVYLISAKLTSPLGVSIVGDGDCELHAVANIDAIFDLAGSMKNVYVNGNNMASKGVQLTSDYCYLERCVFAYCVYGVYNTHDVHKFINCSFQNCTYGLYSADRFINSFIYGMVAQNNQYGIYVTYSIQQPQSLFITHSLFFGNSVRGIYIDKDIFVLCITDCVFDGVQPRAIMLNSLNANLGADITIQNNFIGASEVGIWIGAGYSHVTIDNNRIDNGSFYGLLVLATENVRNTNVVISKNTFGNNASGDIQIDSILGCTIEQNGFGQVSGSNIASVGTYTGKKYDAIVRENTFTAPNRVSFFNTVIRDNIGFVTNKDGISAIGNTFTSVTVPHGLDVTPNFVQIMPYGDIGHVWVTNITATEFTVHCSKAATGDTQFYWKAEY